MTTFKEPEQKIVPKKKESDPLLEWKDYKYGTTPMPVLMDCLVSYQDKEGDFFVEQFPSRVPWSRVTRYRLHPFKSKPTEMQKTENGFLEAHIKKVCNDMAEFLIGKNRAYGNSAASPIGIFARRFDPLAQIDVRIDDKLNRLAKGSEYPGDDTVKDLAGYLLLRMAVQLDQGKDGAN